MPNIQVDYSYKDQLYNVVNLFVDNPTDHSEIQREFDQYVARTYLADLPVDEQPTDFVIEGIMEDRLDA